MHTDFPNELILSNPKGNVASLEHIKKKGRPISNHFPESNPVPIHEMTLFDP